MLRAVVRYVLTLKPVNKAVVSVLSAMGENAWRDRIPVLEGEGVLDLGTDGEIVMSQPAQCQVALELFWNEGRLKHPADRHALEAAMAFARESEVFLDIGAYTGLFAMSAARVNPDIRSYAYEIVPENFQILYENVIRNDLLASVHPRLCGISDKRTLMKMPFSLNAGLLASSVALDWQMDTGVSIPVDSIDQLHGSDGGRTAIKIDVEGFEAEVLEGGRAFLTAHKPDILERLN